MKVRKGMGFIRPKDRRGIGLGRKKPSDGQRADVAQVAVAANPFKDGPSIRGPPAGGEPARAEETETFVPSNNNEAPGNFGGAAAPEEKNYKEKVSSVTANSQHIG